MPHTITQNSSTLNNSLSVPSDGIDPVNETSVDPVFQNLLNNTYYLAYTQLFTRPRLEMGWADAIPRIYLLPFNGLWVSTNNVAVNVANWVSLNLTSTVFLSAANLSPPGAFAASTSYYVYCFASGSPPIPAFEISTTIPDNTLTFKTSDITRRYIGSFITNPAAGIVHFSMIGSDYFLYDSQGVIAGPTTTTLNTSIPVGAAGFYYPQTATVLKLRSRIVNDGHTVGGGQATVSFLSGPNIYNTVTTDFGVTYPVLTSMTVNSELPLLGSSLIRVDIVSDGVTTITVDNIATGYKE